MKQTPKSTLHVMYYSSPPMQSAIFRSLCAASLTSRCLERHLVTLRATHDPPWMLSLNTSLLAQWRSKDCIMKPDVPIWGAVKWVPRIRSWEGIKLMIWEGFGTTSLHQASLCRVLFGALHAELREMAELWKNTEVSPTCQLSVVCQDFANLLEITRGRPLLKGPQRGWGVAGTRGTGFVWRMIHQNHQMGAQ